MTEGVLGPDEHYFLALAKKKFNQAAHYELTAASIAILYEQTQV